MPGPTGFHSNGTIIFPSTRPTSPGIAVGRYNCLKSVSARAVRSEQPILTEHVCPLVEEDGVYLCKDVHTSYAASQGGSLEQAQTFIEHMRHRIDEPHAWYTGGAPAGSMARTTRWISFYESMVVLEKKAFAGPVFVETGYPR